jgi:hypothetical protein
MCTSQPASSTSRSLWVGATWQQAGASASSNLPLLSYAVAPALPCFSAMLKILGEDKAMVEQLNYDQLPAEFR